MSKLISSAVWFCLLLFLVFSPKTQAGNNCPTIVPLNDLSYLTQNDFEHITSIALGVQAEHTDMAWIADNDLVVAGPQGIQLYSVGSDTTASAEAVCDQEVLYLERASDTQIAFVNNQEVATLDFPDTEALLFHLVEGIPTAFAYNETGNLVAVATSSVDDEFGFLYDSQITLLHPTGMNDDPVVTLRTELSGVTQIWFGQNNHQLLVAGYNAGLEGIEVQLWDIDTAEQIWNRQTIAQIQELDRLPFITAITSSGSRIFVAVLERSGIRDEYEYAAIQIWDLATGTLFSEFEAGAEIITALSLHPVMPFLMDGAISGTIRLWDIESGSSVFSVAEHEAPIDQVSFNHDGSLFASIDSGGNIRLWGTSPR